MSTVAGEPMPAATLVRAFARLGWRNTFKNLSAFAAILSNSEGALSEETQRTLRMGVDELAASEQPVRREIGRRLQRATGDLLIAHERLVYFMQAMAVHHCPADGANPAWGDLVLLMLACNDHIIEWVRGRERLAPTERSVADVFIASRFDTYDAALAAFVRGAWLFADPPASWEPERKALWPQLHQAAFNGLSFDDYFESFLGPLAMISFRWGLGPAGVVPPNIDPATWLRCSRALQPLKSIR